jgi:hypothetical protein
LQKNYQGSPEVPPLAFISKPPPTIRPEAMPAYCCTNYTDVEESDSDKNDNE